MLALYGARTAATCDVDHDYGCIEFSDALNRVTGEGIFENRQLNDLEAFMRMLGA